MRISELFQDKYTVIFVLIVVLLVSVWISRTYRNGGFGSWIAPSEGYGTGVIEGLALQDHVRYQGEVRTQLSHAPVTTTGSRSDGTLIINQCSYVKGSETTFRFLFTTTAELRGVSGTTPAKTVTIKVPTYYIQNTSAAGLKATMRAYTGPLPATVGTSAGTAADLDTAADGRGLAVTVPVAAGAAGAAEVADVGYCVITYTIQTANPMAAGKYALEISGLKWVNNEITPGTSAAPGPSLANVSLASNAETASPTLVLVNLSPPSDAAKQLRIFNDTTYGGLATLLPCRKITTESPQLSPNYTGSATTFSITMMLTNAMSAGDIFLVQVPYVTRTANIDLGVSFVWTNPTTSLQDTLSTISSAGVITSDVNTYGGGQNVVAFTLGGSVPNNTPVKLTIAGLQTPAAKTSTTTAKIRTYKTGATLNNAFTADGGVLDQGEYILPAIEARAATTAVSTGTPTTSGTASDGTTYVTSAAANVLISDVKRQMNWAVEAQKEYESAYKALRSATTNTAKTDAQLKYDVAVARRNRLIASHPDSWYDGANWRYGDDGHVRKCAEPSTLSSNEGNCQNIYRMDVSGNIVKSAEGNNILLMRKCPWKCNNPGQTGSDACRIDADCLKVTRWATYLPDGTQIEKNLLATTRSQYDDIARDTSTSALSEDDIYRRGITRNFRGYGQKPGGPGGPGGAPGLFGSIRDATGSIIRGIGNWIDPNDPAGNKRTAKHNAYYYEDGSPAATAYLGMYNGQGYEEESPFYGASKPMNYYYTTNYYYTDGQAGGSAGGAATGDSSKPSKVMPYEQSISL